MSIAIQIEEFVGQLAVGRGVASVGRDEDLLGAEVIDSLGIAELTSFLEHEYGVTVDDGDLDPENFRTIDAIVAFVEAKRT